MCGSNFYESDVNIVLTLLRNWDRQGLMIKVSIIRPGRSRLLEFEN